MEEKIDSFPLVHCTSFTTYQDIQKKDVWTQIVDILGVSDGVEYIRKQLSCQSSM